MAHGNDVVIAGRGGVDVGDIFGAYDKYLGVYERTGGVGALRTLHEFSKGIVWRGVADADMVFAGGRDGRISFTEAAGRIVGGIARSGGLDQSVGSGVDAFSGTTQVGGVNDSCGQGVVVGQPMRGPNYERNKANRERRKAAKKHHGAGKPRLASRSFTGELPDAVVQRKIRENNLAAEKARVALERLLKQEQSGEVDRQIAITRTFQEKQLAGEIALRPNPRVAGWARTVRSGSSGSKWAKTISTGVSTRKPDSSSVSGITQGELDNLVAELAKEKNLRQERDKQFREFKAQLDIVKAKQVKRSDFDWESLCSPTRY